MVRTSMVINFKIILDAFPSNLLALSDFLSSSFTELSKILATSRSIGAFAWHDNILHPGVTFNEVPVQLYNWLSVTSVNYSPSQTQFAKILPHTYNIYAPRVAKGLRIKRKSGLMFAAVISFFSCWTKEQLAILFLLKIAFHSISGIFLTHCKCEFIEFILRVGVSQATIRKWMSRENQDLCDKITPVHFAKTTRRNDVGRSVSQYTAIPHSNFASDI